MEHIECNGGLVPAVERRTRASRGFANDHFYCFRSVPAGVANSSTLRNQMQETSCGRLAKCTDGITCGLYGLLPARKARTKHASEGDGTAAKKKREKPQQPVKPASEAAESRGWPGSGVRMYRVSFTLELRLSRERGEHASHPPPRSLAFTW
eukprot:3915283-Rhodomonas_salina.1